MLHACPVCKAPPVPHAAATLTSVLRVRAPGPLLCASRVHTCSGYQANRPCVWLVRVEPEEVGRQDTRFTKGQGSSLLGGLGTPAPSWDYRLDPELRSVPYGRAVAHLTKTQTPEPGSVLMV